MRSSSAPREAPSWRATAHARSEPEEKSVGIRIFIFGPPRCIGASSLPDAIGSNPSNLDVVAFPPCAAVGVATPHVVVVLRQPRLSVESQHLEPRESPSLSCGSAYAIVICSRV